MSSDPEGAAREAALANMGNAERMYYAMVTAVSLNSTLKVHLLTGRADGEGPP